MATTVSISVTHNADGSYDITSGDTTNAKSWHVTTDIQDTADQLSSIKNKIWSEIYRQIAQIA